MLLVIDSRLIDEGFSFGETSLEVASVATIQAESAVQDGTYLLSMFLSD